jgi:zinc protease
MNSSIANWTRLPEDMRATQLLAAGALAISLHSPLAAAEERPNIPFEKYRLPNGLEVILSQDRSLPLVAVDIWYHVGAANEEPGRTGFAHLFEHMMFTGSKHIARGVAEKLLEGAGGSESNASTSFDRTNYYDTVPSSQLELALWTHADRMGYLLDSLDQAALSNQQDVVRNERRQSYENRPYGIADEALIHALFPEGHPYRAAIIGSHLDIQAASLADVRDFFKRYYRPNNATLTLVGDFDTAEAKRLVQKYFGSFKRGPDVPQPSAITPALTAEKRFTVTDRIELERLDMAWLTAPKFKPDDAELTIAGYILAGGKSSRLFKKLVYELQVAQEVSAGQDPYALTSFFEIQALARSGHTAAELQPLIDIELDRLAAEPPSMAEVESARNQIERSLYQTLQKVGGSGGRADLLNMYNQYTGDPGYLAKDIERYARVTPADVQRVVHETLRKDARVVMLTVRGDKHLDLDAPAPAIARNPGTEAINADERWRKATPKAAAARVPTLPAPQSFVLANGLKVLYLQRPNLPIVSAQLVVDAGRAAGDPSFRGVSDFTAAMLEEGTATRSSQQLSDEIEHLGAAYDSQTSRDVTSLEIDALARNFPDALALLADMAQHPTFPPAEIERQRDSRLSTIAELREDAGALADVALARALYGSAHPYGSSTIGTVASVKRIGQADLRSLWQRYFRPDNAALIVVGAIDGQSLKTLVERLWGGWRPAADGPLAAGNATSAKAATSPARVIIIDKPDSPQTELRIGRIGTVRTNPDFPSMQVLNEAFGGAYTSRLNLDLREDKGYTYGIGSRFTYGRAPGTFVIRTAVRSDVSTPAVKEVFAQLKRVAASPLSSEELRRARGSLTQSLPGLFETNEATANSFADLFAYGLPLDYYRGLPAQFGTATAPALEGLARRYLDPAGMVLIAVGDRKHLQRDLQTLRLGPLEVWPIAGTLF